VPEFGLRATSSYLMKLASAIIEMHTNTTTPSTNPSLADVSV